MKAWFGSLSRFVPTRYLPVEPISNDITKIVSPTTVSLKALNGLIKLHHTIEGSKSGQTPKLRNLEIKIRSLSFGITWCISHSASHSLVQSPPPTQPLPLSQLLVSPHISSSFKGRWGLDTGDSSVHICKVQSKVNRESPIALSIRTTLFLLLNDEVRMWVVAACRCILYSVRS